MDEHGNEMIFSYGEQSWKALAFLLHADGRVVPLIDTFSRMVEVLTLSPSYLTLDELEFHSCVAGEGLELCQIGELRSCHYPQATEFPAVDRLSVTDAWGQLQLVADESFVASLGPDGWAVDAFAPLSPSELVLAPASYFASFPLSPLDREWQDVNARGTGPRTRPSALAGRSG